MPRDEIVHRWGRAARVLMFTVVFTTGCGLGGLNTGGLWVDGQGDEVGAGVLLSRPGPTGHCDWGSATFLFVGREVDVPGIAEEWYDQYIRDPERIFRSELAAAFDDDVDPPDDTVYSGYSTETMELWLATSDPASVYLKIGDKFERWPRVRREEAILCA